MPIDISEKTDARLFAIIGGKTMAFQNDREKFEALADAWDDHNVGRAIINLNHPAYHQIMSMGVAAIPMLLDRLRIGEGEWVYALKMISGQQADTPEMSGNPEQVIDAWLKWGDSTERWRSGRF